MEGSTSTAVMGVLKVWKSDWVHQALSPIRRQNVFGVVGGGKKMPFFFLFEKSTARGERDM